MASGNEIQIKSESTGKTYNWETFRIPEACLGVDIVVGVDEAGRGPVLGPLVYAVAFWPVSEDEEIQKMGFNDSKQLKEGERSKLLERIRQHPSIGWVIEEIPAQSISEHMLRSSPVSLNALSFEAVVRALKKIVSVPNPPQIDHVFVDTVGDPSYYKKVLESSMGEDYIGKFTVEPKADAKFKTVSAASIVAKVTRDTILENWVWEEPNIDFDKNFGSGYPGDETCSTWLKNATEPLFGYPNLVRFSWSTTNEMLKKTGAINVKWECDDVEDAVNTPSITSFFGANKPKLKRARTQFFAKRKLVRLNAHSLFQ